MFETGFPKHWTTLRKLIWLYGSGVAGGAKWVWQLVTGTAPLALLDAVAHPLKSLTQYGLCVQDGTPTPDAPVDILCNNGEIKARHHSGLPLGYTLLEYIQSTGSQYINTNITGSTNAVIDMQGTPCTDEMVVFMLAPLNASSYQNGFGQYRSTMGGNFYVGTRRIYNVSYTSSSLTINGVGPLDRYIANNVNLALFGSTSSNRRISNAKLYSAKIYNNDTLVRDFIPAKNSSNVVGLYDLVSGQFFTNRGTGDFTAGAIVDDPIEIYTDGTPEVLTICGKNLFNKAIADANRIYGYFADTGTSWTFTAAGFSFRFPCKPNTTYTARYNGNKTQAVLGFGSTSSDEVPVSTGKITVTQAIRQGSPTISTPVTLTTGASDKWLIVAFNSTDPQHTDMLDNLQVEEGSTATAYEPYVTPQTVTDVPPLFSVDTVKDDWEAVHGPLTHRIGLYVIKGSDDEGWTENTTYSGTFYADCLPQAVKHPAMSLFTRYKGVDSSTAVSGMSNGTAKCGSSSNRQRIFIRDTSCADVDALKAKLSGFYADGEPCIVAFALATEQTEQTTPHSLHTTQGTNVVDVTSNVDPVQLEIEYAKGAA